MVLQIYVLYSRNSSLSLRSAKHKLKLELEFHANLERNLHFDNQIESSQALEIIYSLIELDFSNLHRVFSFEHLSWIKSKQRTTSRHGSITPIGGTKEHACSVEESERR